VLKFLFTEIFFLYFLLGIGTI